MHLSDLIRGTSWCSGQRLAGKFTTDLRAENKCVWRESSDTHRASPSPCSSKSPGTVAEEGVGKIVRVTGK